MSINERPGSGLVRALEASARAKGVQFLLQQKMTSILYRASTDENGEAKMDMAEGRYDLTVYRVHYETSPTTVEVREDVGVQVEMLFAPKAIEDSYWG